MAPSGGATTDCLRSDYANPAPRTASAYCLQTQTIWVRNHVNHHAKADKLFTIMLSSRFDLFPIRFQFVFRIGFKSWPAITDIC